MQLFELTSPFLWPKQINLVKAKYFLSSELYLLVLISIQPFQLSKRVLRSLSFFPYSTTLVLFEGKKKNTHSDLNINFLLSVHDEECKLYVEFFL